MFSLTRTTLCVAAKKPYVALEFCSTATAISQSSAAPTALHVFSFLCAWYAVAEWYGAGSTIASTCDREVVGSKPRILPVAAIP